MRGLNGNGPVMRAPLAYRLGSSLWLRADLGVTIATGVSQLKDYKSGIALAQATGSKQPTPGTGQNGRQKLTFSAASSQELVLTNTNPFAGGSITLAVVCKFSSTGTRRTVFNASDNGTGGVHVGMSDGTGTKRTFGCITTGDNTGGNATTSPEIWIWNQTDSGATTLSVNGVDTAVTGAFDMKDPGALSALRIGSYNGAVLFFDGDFYEVIGFARSLNTLEQARLTSALKLWYAL